MNQYGTPNTRFQSGAEIGGSFKIFTRKDKLYQGGGTIALAGLKAGDKFGEGTMVIFKGPGKEVEIVKATDAEEKLNQVNGLLAYPVVIPEGCELATCAVCYAGRLYADRVELGIPASVEKQLPMVEFVREA